VFTFFGKLLLLNRAIGIAGENKSSRDRLDSDREQVVRRCAFFWRIQQKVKGFPNWMAGIRFVACLGKGDIAKALAH
jgi:hypothetical protein